MTTIISAAFFVSIKKVEPAPKRGLSWVGLFESGRGVEAMLFRLRGWLAAAREQVEFLLKLLLALAARTLAGQSMRAPTLSF